MPTPPLACARHCFSDNVPSSHRPDSPKRLYDAAAELGSQAGTAEVCAETFKACQDDAATLVASLRDNSEQ